MLWALLIKYLTYKIYLVTLFIQAQLVMQSCKLLPLYTWQHLLKETSLIFQYAQTNEEWKKVKNHVHFQHISAVCWQINTLYGCFSTNYTFVNLITPISTQFLLIYCIFTRYIDTIISFEKQRIREWVLFFMFALNEIAFVDTITSFYSGDLDRFPYS